MSFDIKVKNPICKNLQLKIYDGIANSIKKLDVYNKKTYKSQLAKEVMDGQEDPILAARKYNRLVCFYEACHKLKDNNADPNKILDIDQEWFNKFTRISEDISSEEMQKMWSEILAREAETPGSFSIKALKILEELDKAIANLFNRLCSCCLVFRVDKEIIDAKVCSLDGTAGNNSLINFGLGFTDLNLLEEYGLITSDYNCWREFRYSAEATDIDCSITSCLSNYILDKKDNVDSNLKIYGVQLSKVGKELLPIVNTKENDRYFNKLNKYLEPKGFEIKRSNNDL
ncbi:DUF2806 domain-containing protein [Francisella sciaenopsi]|uniref:TIGR03899 family protein n=1 Tax=Francisella sciaenopsi TaxID=3055034 RepID=A0ABQ6PFZ6_9GAMM